MQLLMPFANIAFFVSLKTHFTKRVFVPRWKSSNLSHQKIQAQEKKKKRKAKQLQYSRCLMHIVAVFFFSNCFKWNHKLYKKILWHTCLKFSFTVKKQKRSRKREKFDRWHVYMFYCNILRVVNNTSTLKKQKLYGTKRRLLCIIHEKEKKKK